MLKKIKNPLVKIPIITLITQHKLEILSLLKFNLIYKTYISANLKIIKMIKMLKMIKIQMRTCFFILSNIMLIKVIHKISKIMKYQKTIFK